MNEVKVAELKARLSHYLRKVRRGQSVTVLDRCSAAEIEALQWSRTETPGDDRLRRGRFVGAVASRGTGGLVKPRQTTNAKNKTVANDHYFALAA